MAELFRLDTKIQAERWEAKESTRKEGNFTTKLGIRILAPQKWGVLFSWAWYPGLAIKKET